MVVVVHRSSWPFENHGETISPGTCLGVGQGKKVPWHIYGGLQGGGVHALKFASYVMISLCLEEGRMLDLPKEHLRNTNPFSCELSQHNTGTLNLVEFAEEKNMHLLCMCACQCEIGLFVCLCLHMYVDLCVYSFCISMHICLFVCVYVFEHSVFMYMYIYIYVYEAWTYMRSWSLWLTLPCLVRLRCSEGQKVPQMWLTLHCQACVCVCCRQGQTALQNTLKNKDSVLFRIYILGMAKHSRTLQHPHQCTSLNNNFRTRDRTIDTLPLDDCDGADVMQVTLQNPPALRNMTGLLEH